MQAQPRPEHVLELLSVYRSGDEPVVLCFPAYDMTLSDLYRRRSVLDHATGILLTDQITSGLAHVHGRKIYRGDLKPANILAQVRAATLHSAIADFGAARQVPPTGRDAAEFMGKDALARAIFPLPVHFMPCTYQFAAPELSLIHI